MPYAPGGRVDGAVAVAVAHNLALLFPPTLTYPSPYVRAAKLTNVVLFTTHRTHAAVPALKVQRFSSSVWAFWRPATLSFFSFFSFLTYLRRDTRALPHRSGPNRVRRKLPPPILQRIEEETW